MRCLSRRTATDRRRSRCARGGGGRAAARRCQSDGLVRPGDLSVRAVQVEHPYTYLLFLGPDSQARVRGVAAGGAAAPAGRGAAHVRLHVLLRRRWARTESLDLSVSLPQGGFVPSKRLREQFNKPRVDIYPFEPKDGDDGFNGGEGAGGRGNGGGGDAAGGGGSRPSGDDGDGSGSRRGGSGENLGR